MKHRVLFIAYLFPPIANSGTQRPLKFAKYLNEYGWEPIVLTAADFTGHATDPHLFDELGHDIEVVRVPMLHEAIGRSLTRLMGGTRLGARIGEGISWRLQHRYQMPDWYALWRPTAMRAAMRLFRRGGFDAIYATGYPWSSLLLGCDLAKATGRPLLADFRDLWSGDEPFRPPTISFEQHLALERQVVECARAVTTPTKFTARDMAATHPAHAAKISTIYNGFDPADLDVPPADRDPSRPFRIAFAGVWKDGYNPAELYDAIDWLRRSEPRTLDGVEVIAAGFPPGFAAQRGLTAHITEPGMLAHRAATALMRSADLLYLSHVDPKRQWAVPGKLYEYVASGKPVMALTLPHGETRELIEELGGGIAIAPDDPGALYEAIRSACRARRVDAPPVHHDRLAAFARRRLTGQLAAVLDAITSRALSRAALPHGAPAAASAGPR